MTRLRYVLLAIVIGIPALMMISCTKEPRQDQCPVIYSIDTSREYKLQDRWKFVGFENMENGTIESPTCGNIEAWIGITDSSMTAHGNSSNPAYKNSFRFHGVALINHYSGSYNIGENNNIEFSQTVKTTVTGTSQVQDFEARFHNLLSSVTRYEIVNNELFLFPDHGKTVLHFVAE